MEGLNYSAYQQQQNQQQPPNRFGIGNNGAGGGATTPMGIMQQRLAGMHEGHQFGGASYAQQHQQQGTPASIHAAPPPTSTITPPGNFSPYGNTPPTTSRSPSLSNNPQNKTMAAPLTSNPTQPSSMQSPIKTSIPLPNPPSAETAARDQERVTLLLEINQLLLQEIVNLQEAGKGGDVQSPAKTGEGGEKDGKVASQEYVDCMRRMQSNLAYLANVAERSTRPNQPNMPWPPLMGVPTTGPAQLPEMYIKLQNMFPAWKAQQAQQKAGGNLSPGPGSSGGTPGN